MVDLAPLAALTGLQHINCTNTMVADLTPLVSLTGLQHLHCHGILIDKKVGLRPLARLMRAGLAIYVLA